MYHTESKDRASLLTEVRNLHRASDKINQEAENLAKALKGDKRLQGNWGELVLERVLDESGLRKDHEYTLQATRRTEDGDAKRPDVIIHLPDDKDIIVDSKVSLVAYERAVAAEDDAVRDDVRCANTSTTCARRSNGSSEQEYDRLQGVRSLDFVLLFVPIESAFMLAMEYDQGAVHRGVQQTHRHRQPDDAADDAADHSQRLALREADEERAGDRAPRRRAVRQAAPRDGRHGRSSARCCAPPTRAIRPRCRSSRAGRAIWCGRSNTSANWAPACADRFRSDLLDTAEDASELDPLDAVAELTLPDDSPDDCGTNRDV